MRAAQGRCERVRRVAGRGVQPSAVARRRGRTRRSQLTGSLMMGGSKKSFCNSLQARLTLPGTKLAALLLQPMCDRTQERVARLDRQRLAASRTASNSVSLNRIGGMGEGLWACARGGVRAKCRLDMHRLLALVREGFFFVSGTSPRASGSPSPLPQRCGHRARPGSRPAGPRRYPQSAPAPRAARLSQPRPARPQSHRE